LTFELQGIVPPLVTPLAERDMLDEAGLERLLEHVIAGGVSGIFILGTTGEAPSLSYRLRREMIRRVCKQVNSRIPVLVGITDTSFVESIHLAEFAAEAGADKLVLAMPYYFPAGQTELKWYVRHIVNNLPLPLLLYNMPALTKVWFDIDSLRELADLPQIVGVKDSSGDLGYFAKLAQLKEVRPDWRIFMGPEHFLTDAVRLGADGGVNGGANVFPQLFADLYQASTSADQAAIANLQAQVHSLQRIYDIGKYASRHIKATKCALSIRDICSDVMAEPFNHFELPQRQQVASILEELQSLGLHA